jgi:hypothetical protein
MTMLFPMRKPCPLCGKPMKLAADESTKGSERYVCSDCDDPMRNPLTRNWVDGPLRPPEE